MMKKFGLIGHPLSHSFSKKYFEDKFQSKGIKDCTYELFPMETLNNLNEWINGNSDLVGFNVTIPHKIAILPFLNEIDAAAKAIGAVNTVKVNRNGTDIQLKGYNTDAFGFKQSIKPFLASHHHKALIFGTGGSSKAVQFVLEEIGVECFFVSRQSNNEMYFPPSEVNEHLLRSFHLIINCTPLGMFPNINSSPLSQYNGIGQAHLVYDLVYNPEETLLMKECKAKGATVLNGLSMLHLQADKAWEIWNS